MPTRQLHIQRRIAGSAGSYKIIALCLYGIVSLRAKSKMFGSVAPFLKKKI